MWQYLSHISAQQTTAPELATFLVLVTIACIGAGAIFYAGIMTIAWAVTLRSQCSWREAVFPSFARFRQFTAEYVLAGLTATVLTLTLAEKDALVDEVLAVDAKNFLDTRGVAALMPMHRLAPEFRDSLVQQANLTLGNLVREPLLEGRSGEARALVRAVLDLVLNKHPHWHATLARGLTIACVVLMLAYLLWLVGRRVGFLKARADSDPSYRNVFGRLVVLGVCLALLLATPAVAQDPELLTDSALAAARRAPPSPEQRQLTRRMAAEIDRQYVLIGVGIGSDARLQSFIDDVNARLASLPDWRDRLNSIDQTDRVLDDRMTTLTNRLAQLTTGDSLRTRGLLLVEGGTPLPMTIARGAVTVATDTLVGMHWLPPGQYTVSGGRMISRSFTISVGQVLAIRLRPVVVG